MIARIIFLIKEEQNRIAHDSMKFSSDGKQIDFEYGKKVGFYAGLETALLKIEKVLSDQDKREL